MSTTFSVNAYCQHCGEWVPLHDHDNCERCGKSLLPEPSGVGVCERCSGEADTFDTDVNGHYPIICRHCVLDIVNGADW